MNYRLVSRCLGTVAMLIGVAMLLCLPWAFPALSSTPSIEWAAISALIGSAAIAVATGAVLLYAGRSATGRMYRKDALAVVGLSWCLATVLGAFPFLLSGTCRGPAPEDASMQNASPVHMSVIDALFESASGFSGTGATVITELESPALVPRGILFWRSETHFLGGLGIMVLFVAILGHGSNSKVLMVAELAGPSKELPHSRVQHAAWVFGGVYVGLNILLTCLLLLQGVSFFDALCHAFGTIATGGFSTFNASAGHFQNAGIEMTLVVFMAISCVNFALLYYAIILQPGKLLRNAELQTYLAILASASLLVIGFGLYYGDFANLGEALRYGLFQVTSILTNTGFGTHDFDKWNEFGRGLLFLLMFVGGCAGSTSCSIKVIRHMILFKSLSREFELAYHPRVVRPLRLKGELIDADVARQVIVYFAAFLVIAVSAWLLLLVLEHDATWNGPDGNLHEKLMDCASAVGATFNGVGPGLGTVGTTRNYAHFQPASKLLLSCLMLLGRLEIIPIVVLVIPRFWKSLP